ncbi:MAG: DUF4469 domain-containing protein [Treponema sp.]|jgi:hypothetical protein|nr:DUF4469 domain-containing protein [Treponema sp.]
MASASATALINELVEKLHRVHVKLYPNYLKDVEGAFVARTEHENMLTIHDLAASLKNRAGFTGNVADLLDYHEQLMAELKYQLCDGFAVNLGPVSIHPRVGGTWEHPNEAADREKHPITFRTRVRAELSRMAQAITLVCDGQAEDTAYIDEVQDVKTGTENETLSSGGAVVITGHKIKVAGDKPGVGITITGTRAGGTPYTNAILPPYVENTTSKVIAILPAGIPEGTFKIRIITQYAGSGTLLKDVRILESAPLVVGSPTQGGDIPAGEGA